MKSANISKTSKHSHHNKQHKKGLATRQEQSSNIILIIFCLIWLFFAFLLTSSLLTMIIALSSFLLNFTYSADTIPAVIFVLIFITILVSVLLLFYLVPIGLIIGQIRAYCKIQLLDRQIKLTNPHQYYRELPNNIGIGVTSLLVDSKLENEKDIVAVLLDLCAQGYLRLSKHSDHYVIYPQPHTPTSPLANERYVLQLIHQNKLSQINYKKWYQYCVEDGIQLGLYHPTKIPDTKLTDRKGIFTNAASKKRFKTCCIIGILLGIIGIPLALIFTDNDELPSIIAAFALIIAIWLPGITDLILAVINMFDVAKHASHKSYKYALEKHLTKTQLGVTELQKLLAFKSFLAQFNTFVDKDPEAVILWDRYLSYAQVFGLTKEIMQSGYKQLINNAAFKIDDINHITQNNLKIATE